MKRLTAILLSLLLLWVQAMVLAQPALPDAPVKCACCSCKTGKCCVGESTPGDTAPQPVAPAPSATLDQILFTVAVSPAWLLPSGETQAFSAVSASPLFAVRVPLFTRDCALLI